MSTLLQATSYVRIAALTGTVRRIRSRQLLAMVVTAFLIRVLVAILVYKNVAAPTIDHERFGWEMGWSARSLALGRGFGSPFLPLTGPTALVPPLYPFLLSLVFRVFGIYTPASALTILSLNSLFSALTCLPIYAMVRDLLDQRAARYIAWGWVVYPFAIYFSADRVWDYSLTCLLFTTCFWAATKLDRSRRALTWLGFGVLCGLTALSNTSVLIMFPCFLLMAMIAHRSRGEKWLSRGLVAVVGLMLVLTPWMLRNYAALHAFVPVRDNFWLECEAGNNGNAFEPNDHLVHPASAPAEMQKFVAMGEMAYLDRARVTTEGFIRTHPLRFVEYTLHRIVSYWTGYWSFNSAYRRAEPTELPNMLLTITLTCFMVRGLHRLWQLDRRRALPYLLLILFFPLTYYVTHVAPDYRQPIEPEILALAVIGVIGTRARSTSSATRRDLVYTA